MSVRTGNRSCSTTADLSDVRSGQLLIVDVHQQVSNVQVSTIRGGKIVASRDDHNHLMLAEVTGQLTAPLDAITENTSP